MLSCYRDTLQEINISHLGKRNIIFKMDFSGNMLVPRRVFWIGISMMAPFPKEKTPPTPPGEVQEWWLGVSVHMTQKILLRKKMGANDIFPKVFCWGGKNLKNNL